MQNIGAQSFRVMIAVLFVGISTSNAYAYLDPGTGSIILQVLLGGVAGVALAGKLYWHKFLSLFGMGKRSDASEEVPVERRIDADGRRG